MIFFQIDQSSFQTSSLVIVTAANSEFYLPLQSTVYNVHQKFNDSLLIIYDLGLSETMRKKVYFIESFTQVSKKTFPKLIDIFYFCELFLGTVQY